MLGLLLHELLIGVRVERFEGLWWSFSATSDRNSSWDSARKESTTQKEIHRILRGNP